MDTIIILTAIIAAFIITWLSGYLLIPYFKKMKYGQTILDIGPKWHKEKKQGTPTMGGIMFILGITMSFFGTIAILYWGKDGLNNDIAKAQSVKAVSVLLFALFNGAMGFFDDYLKIKKKQNEGLTVIQKFLLQVMLVSAFFTANIIAGDNSTSIKIPFYGDLELGFFYYILVGIAMIYIINAVNLTDGIDGLCSSVTFVYALVFMVILSSVKMDELTILTASLCGGMLGFLVWNFNPAKIFMGDTGSLFLGGLVTAIGVGSGMEIIMIIAAAVYIWEALTVMIQVVYFKATKGKRLFLMTPIHHSFEKRGFSETSIVLLFCFIGIVFGVVAIALQRLM